LGEATSESPTTPPSRTDSFGATGAISAPDPTSACVKPGAEHPTSPRADVTRTAETRNRLMADTLAPGSSETHPTFCTRYASGAQEPPPGIPNLAVPVRDAGGPPIRADDNGCMGLIDWWRRRKAPLLTVTG